MLCYSKFEGISVPDDYKTPGQYIQSLLDERSWSNRVLAIVTGWDESTIHRIVSDKRAMDGELALVLEEVFDVPAVVSQFEFSSPRFL